MGEEVESGMALVREGLLDLAFKHYNKYWNCDLDFSFMATLTSLA